MLSKCKIVLDHELNHGGMSVRSYGIVNTGACLQIRLLSFISSYPKYYGILQLLPKGNINRWREIRKGYTKCSKEFWEEAMGCRLPQNGKICQTHFKASDWKPVNNKGKISKRRRLNPDADL